MTVTFQTPEELEYAWLATPVDGGHTLPVGALTPAETAVIERIPLEKDLRLRQLFMVTEERVSANLRVGLLLETLDRLAETTALRYVQRSYPEARVVTASIDDLKVCAPPSLERDITLLAQINFVGRTSLEVGIRIEHAGENPVHIGSCYFTMVARLAAETGSAVLPQLIHPEAIDRERAERAAFCRRGRARRMKQDPPSVEEWEHLTALHQQDSHSPGTMLPAAELVLSTWERTYPAQENVPETIFGGHILHRAYMAAHMCAELLADQRALLVAADRIDFYEPVRMGDKLHFLSRVTYSGQSSISVETDIVRISRDRTRRELSNTCVFTFVNVDKDLNTLPVPRVKPGSFIEDAKYLAGRRRQARYRSRQQLTQLRNNATVGPASWLEGA